MCGRRALRSFQKGWEGVLVGARYSWRIALVSNNLYLFYERVRTNSRLTRLLDAGLKATFFDVIVVVLILVLNVPIVLAAVVVPTIIHPQPYTEYIQI